MPGPITKSNTRGKTLTGKSNTRAEDRVSETPEPTLEPKQDINDSIEGRAYLKKYLLLCPPGEPPTHNLLATCLHQVAVMKSVSKPVMNAIRAVAFLLGEMEETQINEILKEVFNTQITELTSDMATLIEDAKEKLNGYFKETEEKLTILVDRASQSRPAQPTSYAAVVNNLPPYANPRVAAKEGIKARQFLLEGLINTKFSHTDVFQLKTEFNNFLGGLGLTSGKIRSINKIRNGAVLIEMDSDAAATWLSEQENQDKICNKIGPGVIFRSRVHNLIAFNVPLGISPENQGHRQEVCEANNLDPETITTLKWVKPVHRRSQTQRTAHLFLTFNNADAANRAITNGLYICNRRCHTERVKREPKRCLKCQGWNHYAKECTEELDRCGNCTKNHRTSNCPTPLTRACVSCKTDDHASWSRDCPMFIKKQNDFNDRNPENALQYIPTADPWTWTANVQSAQSTAQPPLIRPHIPREKSQPPRRTQAPRQVDSYIPKFDSYVPNYDRSGRRHQDTDRDWSGHHQAPKPPPPPPPPAAPHIERDLMDSRPLTQEYINTINSDNVASGPIGVPIIPTIILPTD